MHLDTVFTKQVIAEAMQTGTETAFDKYSSLVESVKLYFGPVVTPEFNRRLRIHLYHFNKGIGG